MQFFVFIYLFICLNTKSLAINTLKNTLVILTKVFARYDSKTLGTLSKTQIVPICSTVGKHTGTPA